MNNIIQKVNETIQQNDLGKHEFYTTWLCGKLPLNAIRDYASQYYFFEKEFPNFLRLASKKSKSEEQKKELAENIYEEENVPKHHADVWIDFAEGIGVSKENIMNAELKPATKKLIETFARHSETYLGGVAAAYTYEKQLPKLSLEKIDSLKKHYGVCDEKTLNFFHVHSYMDIKHSDVEAKLIEKYAKTEEEKKIVASSVRECCNALWEFLNQENMLNTATQGE